MREVLLPLLVCALVLSVVADGRAESVVELGVFHDAGWPAYYAEIMVEIPSATGAQMWDSSDSSWVDFDAELGEFWLETSDVPTLGELRARERIDFSPTGSH